MRLKELLHNIINLNFDAEIQGVSCNPRKIREGYLFVCISERDLKSFQAVAVINENYPNINVISDTTVTTGMRIIFHPNPQKIYSEIVSRFYQFKQPEYIAAVTGTNGKTSVVEFCRQIWQNAGSNASSIGTLGTCFDTGKRYNNGNLTTPSADDLYAILRDINNKNVENLVLEASSHGIDQYRIHGLRLHAAAFTNFSPEHLDYHGNVDGYFEAKKRLFYEVLPEGETAILNADIDECNTLLNIAHERGNRIITYGKKGTQITLLKQTLIADGQYLVIKMYDKIYNITFPVFGKFQAHNLLCAMAISRLDYREMHIEKLHSPKGRMEKVNSFAFVDYAHTADALKQSLLSLKLHFRKKIVLVFGCGGNRDKAKRSDMGKIAQKYADRIIITDDNPRDEDPAKIRHDILLHCPNALEVGDRKAALEKGINIAYNKGMVLLVAGKGHEEFQIVGDEIFECSDVSMIRKFMK
ncbi:UDP-N-acetylmuramoyl-L-alanyl-D-glutamate--2,6-diaminopimelate ligase [Wolbachia endosymbiont of Pentalonia nigronervosa]|uniref:Mur ligase family protein n=1 Tax=Wolbachia endosymbiont of Pentalonia nigronervosa TaxID=1301914 RepID=UPI00165F1AE4|nr:UDP-N-acetylmuramoyl-L-alanyl-D-glutamate--2,6-diaminopimelate ligase [Wolbachia endosymbiont of Pentalonia nigronervosa]